MKWYSLWKDLEHGPPSWIGSWIGWIWSNKSLYYFLISLIWFLTFVRTAALQLSFTLALKLNGLILMVHNRYWLNVSNYCRNGWVLTSFCHNRNKLAIKSQCATYNFTTMSTFEFWLIIRHRSNGCEIPHFIYNHTTRHGFFSWASVRTQHRLLTHTPYPQILQLFVKTRPWLRIFPSIRLSCPRVKVNHPSRYMLWSKTLLF